MKKLQRKRRPTNDIEVIEPINTKQSKKKHDSEPVWAMVPCFKEGEDLETATKLWQSLLSSHKKKPRDGKLAKELMESTYVLRRRQILSGLAIPVGEVVAKYPPLCQLSHVSMRSDYL